MMKRAVITEPKGPLQIQTGPSPKPGPGEVLIRVRACGVCHTDSLIQQGRYAYVRFPIVLGHEVAGSVEELGEGVEWPAVRSRIGLPWLYSSCGRCRQCLRGEEIMCAHVEATGATTDGGYQQFMVARAAYVAPLPDALDFAEAAPLMCAGLTTFTGLRNAGFRPGHRVAVIGLGGLGHLAVLFARAMGGRVAVLSTSPEKEDQARALGAERFINTRAETAGKALAAWEGGADVILATAPSVESIETALPGLAPDGTLAVLAVVQDKVAVDAMDFMAGRRRLIGSPSGSRKDLRATLEFAATHGIRPQITRFPLERAGEALELVHHGRLRGRAVLVTD